MPRMNRAMRARALVLLEERQKKFCEINKLEWKGLFCEDMVRGGTIERLPLNPPRGGGDACPEASWKEGESKWQVRIILDGEVAKNGLYGRVDHNGNACKGEFCVDHEDNDNDNNPVDGSNWRVRCRGHNGRKNHRGLTKKESILSTLENNTLKESLESIRERMKAQLKGSDGGNDENKENLETKSAEHEKSKRCRRVVAECVREMISEGDDVEIELYELSLACSWLTEKYFGDGEGVVREKSVEYIRVLAAPRVGEFEIYNKEKRGKKPVWWVRRKRKTSPLIPLEEGEKLRGGE